MNLNISSNKFEKTLIYTVIFLISICIIRSMISLKEIFSLKIFLNSTQGFTVIWMSIILEALPFVMIGSLVSSIIHIFISDDFIVRIIPKKRWLGLLAASLLGMIFPVCECAIVPIMKRLIQKGVPLHIAITFMMAVPIVNPIVLSSTYYAFFDYPSMVLLRGGCGLLGAILIGHIVGKLQSDKKLFKKNVHSHTNCSCTHEHNCGCTHDSDHSDSAFSKMVTVMDHTLVEFYTVGKFLIIGGFLSAFMQTIMPREMILSIGQHHLLSIIIMMLLAFTLSLCSEADAFIARTFVGSFTTGSIVGFLIFGPMIDLKNVLMLGSSFDTKFIFRLITIISFICLSIAIMVNLTGV